jgi:aspartyl-tRNA(Asn)/glutamyl-tRNA(Gln) amidotransferase subunit C
MVENMKKINKEILKKAANNLLFDMTEDQYELLLKEFDILLHQMELIGKIEGVDDEQPMTFPFNVLMTQMRSDVVGKSLSQEEVIKNARFKRDGQIKVPKVIG